MGIAPSYMKMKISGNKSIEELISKAKQRALESPYHGCATSTFTALAEVLEMESRDEVFKCMIGLAGGVGHLTKGTCGALIGAAAAISLNYNKSKRDVIEAIGTPNALHPQDPYIPLFFQDIFEAIALVANKLQEKYGGTLCNEIQRSLYGKAFDLLNPKKHVKFVEFMQSYPVNCYTVESDIVGWTMGILLNK